MNSLNQIQHCISNSTRLQAACTSLNIAFILSDISILHLFLVFTLPLNPNRNLDLNRNSRVVGREKLTCKETGSLPDLESTTSRR
jgi:hypothetical protein